MHNLVPGVLLLVGTVSYGCMALAWRAARAIHFVENVVKANASNTREMENERKKHFEAHSHQNVHTTYSDNS